MAVRGPCRTALHVEEHSSGEKAFTWNVAGCVHGGLCILPNFPRTHIVTLLAQNRCRKHLGIARIIILNVSKPVSTTPCTP
jgi:hypothetical protein